MSKRIINQHLGWYILIAGFIVAFLLFLPMNKMISNLRQEEQKRVELWAKAVSNKAQVVERTQEFYNSVKQDEQIRLQQFIEAYKIIMSQSEDANLSSPKLRFYTKIILDNKTIPVIITDEFNNITLSQNVVIPKGQKVLAGDLYEAFSENEPYLYEVYGMKFRLYYRESDVYANLRRVLDELNTSFLDELTSNTVFAPVIITDSTQKHILSHGNIPSEKLTEANALQTIESMRESNNPIRISLPSDSYGYVFYQKNAELTVLKYYPFLYIFIFLLVIILFYKVFQTIRQSQQNNVWVGMSKETAHQLGTPISSLMAWTELLRSNPQNSEACKEMDKDIHKLDLITQRFSQIGSEPTLKDHDITLAVYEAVSYIQSRSPKKVVYQLNVPLEKPVIIKLNKPLFEWTVENLCKNAIDAMQGSGTITVDFEDMGSHVHLDISDTGKGLHRNQFKKIFSPGYTTKARGWGLGLSLAKRIIEQYHKGKIYVKNSAIDNGTTIRIELNKQ